ncbi:G patch domain containing 4 [Anopheles darlingi]|uniref:G patch domain-containing protein 4 n=1 Tax=Anopheles darlingi TaxID=43151 RepID=W5J765_ANODA|nr:G patch domain-containing protein 4 [Anopheles darlingi]ETN58705.1 G patch domain containing 4 [Anopheles darlingi]
MDFAKNILQKYGWKEGDGLGKNTDGIVAPIKASLKFNTAGLGQDPAKDLTNNWWERVYNDAAGNIAVENGCSAGAAQQEPVRLRQVETDAVEISTAGFSVRKLKKKSAQAGEGQSRYGTSFLRASVLMGGTGREETVANHTSTEDIEYAPVKMLTDEELFAACGGRTAHKGARHGLKLSGKLARIDEQNSKLLKQLESNSFEAVIKSNDWQVQLSRNGRKKTKKQKRNEQRWVEHGDGAKGKKEHGDDDDDEVKDMVHHADYVVAKNRKKRKAHERTEQELADEMVSMFAELPEEDGLEEEKEVVSPKLESKKKLKQSQRKQLSADEELDLLSDKIRKLDHSSVTIKKRERKKKAKRKTVCEQQDDEDIAIGSPDPAAKYRKGYRRDAKQNNRLLKAVVPHEVPETPSKDSKPKRLLCSDSSDGSDEEDVVSRVNEEQNRYWKKMRANVPKIKIIEPTEDDCLALGQELKERHKNEVKRVANRSSSGKRKKSKRKERCVAQLADSLSKKL